MMDKSQLKPYKSLIIAKARSNVLLTPLVNQILDDLEDCLDIGSTSERQMIDRTDAFREGKLTVGLLHYREERPPSWTFETDLLDSINHLAVVCRKKRYVAIYLSESNRKRSVANRIVLEGDSGLGGLALIPRGLLNAAFVNGPARTLWLSGTHRRTSIKADNKILSGLDLRDTLDPLDDQTFHFTAARCVPVRSPISEPVGISPRKSQLWMGPSRNWADFRTTVSNLLSYVENVKTPTQAPLPIIAISSPDATNVAEPFDIALVPPELLADDPTMDKDTREQIELWGYQSNFEVVHAEDNQFVAEASLKGELLGKIRFDLEIISPERVLWEVEGVSSEVGKDALFEEALKLVQKRDWVKIWFESGHTVSDGEIFEVRHRDMPFLDLEWANLKEFDVGKEKPSPLTEVGNQDSLFDWMQLFWPNLDKTNTHPGGWLSSDDGAMEIADFIHLDDTVQPPVLTLIHVKGSGNKNPKRPISVSDYEVVTAQAVKNLRSLDRLLLAEGLENGLGKEISKLVWHDRVQSTREEMIAALATIGTSYRRRVFVFQPRLTKSMLTQTREDKKGSNYARLRQLDTLLLSAAATSKGLGVEFKVLGEDI